MDAQDQPIGPRVFWTIGFLALGTLSAIGAAALFPWYLAIVIAILVAGLASACAFQFRETKNLLYLVAMLAMTALAAFLDGVSVWEILNKRQNSQHRGVVAEQSVYQEQLKGAETRVADLREEIAALSEQAQNMDNDGIKENDRLIPGVLAKIESKKADLPNMEAKVAEMRNQLVSAASTSAVSEAGRHVLLQMADQHESPAQWLILRASIIFCIPELTLALLAWSLRGAGRGQVRPQPVVIVPHPGMEPAQQAHFWQAMAHGGGPHMAHGGPHLVYGGPPMAMGHPSPAPLPAAGLSYGGGMQPGMVAMSGSEVPPPAAKVWQEAPVRPAEVSAGREPVEPVPMGMGQMMMAASHRTEESAVSNGREAASWQGEKRNAEQMSRPERPALSPAAPSGDGLKEDEDVMLSPDSVPELSQRGAGLGERHRGKEPAAGTTSRPAGGVPSRGAEPLHQLPDEEAEIFSFEKEPSVLEAAKNRSPQSGKSSPTKLAKNAAAKRSRKGGMRSRGASLAELASRLN